MNKFYLVITADTNDADYVTKISEISREVLTLIDPIVEKIKKFKSYSTPANDRGAKWTHSYNWPRGGEYCPRTDLGEKYPHEIYNLSEDDVEFFNEFVPYSVHTITEIRVLEVVNETELFKKKYF